MPESTPAPFKMKHEVLVFTKTVGFRHGSIPGGLECMKQLGAKTGLFNVTHSEDPALFAPESLKKFGALIMLNTTGEIFKDAPAGEAVLKKSLVDFVQSGKGLVGVHSATDTCKDWKEYTDMMGGAFAGHPWNSKDEVRLKNLAPNHPLMGAFKGEGLTLREEMYIFRPDTAKPDARRMLLAIDLSGPNMDKDDGNKDAKPDRDLYPVSWVSTYGNGKTFYCSLGHNGEIFRNPVTVQHYLAGIQFALGELPAAAAPKAVTMLMSDGTMVARN